MHFIKIRKFNMDRAYKTFESSLIFIKSHPEWYANPGPSDYEFTKQADSPVIFMKKRDAQNRRIIIHKFKNYKNISDSNKIMRMMMLSQNLLTFTREDVEHGLVTIVDERELTFKTFTKFAPKDLIDSGKSTDILPIRYQKIFILGMPTFVQQLYLIAKSFMSKKVAERMHLIQNVEELKEHMDISLLTKEYGGSETELTDFDEFEYGIKFLNILNKFEVNFSRIHEFENVGSFRKLEVD